MKFRLIFTIFLALLLFSCLTQYHLELKHEIIPANELKIYIFSSEYSSKCFVRVINHNFGNQLNDIEFINGWIEFGDYLFIFEKETIDISLTLDNNLFFQMFPVPVFSSPHNNFIINRNGNISHLNVILTEEEKIKILLNATHIKFEKEVDYQIIKDIYRQNFKNVKLYLEYNLLKNDEIINIKLNENMIIEFIRRY